MTIDPLDIEVAIFFASMLTSIDVDSKKLSLSEVLERGIDLRNTILLRLSADNKHDVYEAYLQMLTLDQAAQRAEGRITTFAFEAAGKTVEDLLAWHKENVYNFSPVRPGPKESLPDKRGLPPPAAKNDR